MKKPNFKNILKRFTIIDILIILCVIGAVVFAFTHIGGSEDSNQSISFDSSTLNKLPEKYLSFYRQGNIVKSHVGGYNSSSGEYEEVYGRVIWVDDDNNGHTQILLNINGNNILAGLYKDDCNPDIYIEYITLETDGTKYKNLTEIQIRPMSISNLDEIVSKIPERINYTIESKIAIDTKDSQIFQELANELYSNGKKRSVRQFNENVQNQISLIMAQKNELNIASEILGTINGQTSFITIRIYDSNDEDIENIKNSFDVINVLKIT
ncbi:MAG: adhesin [Methanobrevibacter sp.]|nr:adhesin [Methanobrevibacter sp.]